MPRLYIPLCSHLYSFYRDLHLPSTFLYRLLLHFNSVYFSQHPDLFHLFLRIFFYIFIYSYLSFHFFLIFFNPYIYSYNSCLEFARFGDNNLLKERFKRIFLKMSCRIKNHNSINILKIFRKLILKKKISFFIYFYILDLILICNKCILK